MQADYLIIGQGICGTFLSWNLIKAGKSVIVIDEEKDFTASKIASGIINPVTGRRIVRTWMIDTLLPFAYDAYTELGNTLSINLVEQCDIIDFHPTKQMQDAFEERALDETDYLTAAVNEKKWWGYFDFHFGAGIVAGSLLCDIQAMIAGWKAYLKKNDLLIESAFKWSDCVVSEDGVQYGDITANKIICCEGVAGIDNPFFNRLPYAANKGEVIIASIPGLPRTHIYKQGISIVPWKEDLFWIGSNYEWKYEHTNPTEAFRQRTEEQLKRWLKLPYTLVDHWASERPANMERRPFVGLHPLYPNVGVFNGMGSKGCSLAPFFAHQFTEHLLHGTSLTPEADVKRFEKILSR